jgi:hypothetical protein
MIVKLEQNTSCKFLVLLVITARMDLLMLIHAQQALMESSFMAKV